jgi:hypothetical protein
MRRRAVLKRGIKHSGRLRMPGQDATWQPISSMPPVA